MSSIRKELKGVVPYPVSTSRKGKIRLDLNENVRGCSPTVIEAIKNVKMADISIYPEYEGLIHKIAVHYGVTPNNVLLTNGADDAIHCIMDTYIEHNNGRCS